MTLKLKAYDIYGPEGNGVVLRLSQTADQDHIVLSIERFTDAKSVIQTIRLDYDAWKELMGLDSDYDFRPTFKKKEDEAS